ncbi:MAG: CHAT domain-containing protein [Polyangiaceae bacterium]|nr:CHAT domain-containing protein [Polyangiaceae bacterium]
MSSTHPMDWHRFFADRAERVRALHIGEVKSQLALELEKGGPAALADLKRFVRETAREPERCEVDPLFVDAVLRGVSTDVRGVLPSLGKEDKPSLHDPTLEMRVVAITRSVVNLLATSAEGASVDFSNLTRLPAGRVVLWYLTGQNAPAPSDGEAWNVVGAALAADEVLGPLGILSPRSVEARRAQMRVWSLAAERLSNARPTDAVEGVFWSEMERRKPDIALARRAFAFAFRGGDYTVQAEGSALGLLSRLSTEERQTGPAGLANFCSAAQVVGLLALLPRRDHRLASYGSAFSSQLVNDLPMLLRSQPVSPAGAQVGFVFWRSVALLARELLRTNNLTDLTFLLAATAETGALTRAIADQVARVVDVVELEVESAIGAEVRLARATRFLARLAFRALEQRNTSADRLYRDGLKRVGDAGRGAAAKEVALWFEPKADPDLPAAPKVIQMATCLLGLPDGTSPADVAQRFQLVAPFPQMESPLAPKVVRLGEWVHKAAEQLGTHRTIEKTAPSAAGGTASKPVGSGKVWFADRLSLTIEELEGRHGELYLLFRLFAASSHGIKALLDAEHYPRPADASDEMEEVHRAVDELRRRASGGLSGAGDIQAVQKALGALAPRRLWAQLGRALSDKARLLEISAPTFGIPWELCPIPPTHPEAENKDLPIALHLPAVRRRSGDHVLREREPLPPAMLLLYDSEHPGALEEAAAIQRIVRDFGGKVTTVTHASDLTHLPNDTNIQIVHYAGHQGPGSDATPALALGETRLALRQLLDFFHDRPPDLLFLNACSTLRPSEKVATGDRRGSTHLSFGPLDALLGSSIPCLAGTLWDILPPAEPLFVKAFYTAVFQGRSYPQAMFQARSAVANVPGWEACFPAYVLVAPG